MPRGTMGLGRLSTQKTRINSIERRHQRIVGLVARRPGITQLEIETEMGFKSGGLFGAISTLIANLKIKRQGGGFILHPMSEAALNLPTFAEGVDQEVADRATPEEIKAAIAAKGMTISGLAQELKVTPSTLRNVVNGVTRSDRVKRFLFEKLFGPNAAPDLPRSPQTVFAAHGAKAELAQELGATKVGTGFVKVLESKLGSWGNEEPVTQRIQELEAQVAVLRAENARLSEEKMRLEDRLAGASELVRMFDDRLRRGAKRAS